MLGIVSVRSASVAVGLAIAAGFFVQNDAADNAPRPPAPSQASDTSQLRPLTMVLNAEGLPVFGLPETTNRPIRHDLTTRSTLEVGSVYVESDVPRLGTVMATPVGDCSVDFVARPAADAMVALSALLPCATDKDILIEHAMIGFSARTDADGRLDLVVPALAVDAEFRLLIDNVEHARIGIPVDAVRQYDRAILQWRGTGNLQLHAFAAGAAIGDAGHVWSASVQDTSGSRGAVQRLGSTRAEIPLLAEIYTYPLEDVQDRSGMSLQIGVALTDDNCGRATDVTTYQISRGDLASQQDLSLVMPGCDKAGTVVLLDNQFSLAVQAMH